MMKEFTFITALIIFTGCHTVLHSVYSNGKGLSGNGHFVYTYADNNLRPPDTIVADGLVINVESYGGVTYQDYFTLQQLDPVKNTTARKKIQTAHIVYAKIKSLDGSDSVEYTEQAGEIWRVVKRRSNVTLLYRSYAVSYQDFTEANNVLTGVDHFRKIKLLRSGKATPEISLGAYNKSSILDLINKRYNKTLTERDFKDIDEMTDYILDIESINISN